MRLTELGTRTTLMTAMAAGAGALIWWHSAGPGSQPRAVTVPPRPALEEVSLSVETAADEAVPVIRVPELEPQPLPPPPSWHPVSAVPPRPRLVMPRPRVPCLGQEAMPGIQVPDLVPYAAPPPARSFS